jgi:hypothetical protein
MHKIHVFKISVYSTYVAKQDKKGTGIEALYSTLTEKEFNFWAGKFNSETPILVKDKNLM